MPGTRARLPTLLDLGGALAPSGAARVALCSWFAVVCGVTVAVWTRSLSVVAIASSPRRIAEGQLWRLLTCAFVVQRPLVASVLALVGLTLLTAVLCGFRLLWVTAFAGHVGSTLLAYTTLGLYRLAEPHAFQGLLSRPDYGVSAISAAWLGAVAAAGWTRRGQTLEGRAAIALVCAAIALFAWMLRGGLTVLDSDHIFAFAVGVTLALALPRGASRPFQRQKALVDLHRA